MVNYAIQGQVSVVTTEWRALQVGSVNLKNRQYIRYQAHGKPGNALCIAYANINADGTFTAPTIPVNLSTVYRGTATVVEPISDKVTVYGRLWKKAASTESSLRVIVSEMH